MSQSIMIQVNPKIESCWNYSARIPVSVVLAPIRVFQENGKIIIAYACSLSKECDFHKCYYRWVKDKDHHDFGVNLENV